MNDQAIEQEIQAKGLTAPLLRRKMKTEITLTITCGEKTCGECQYKAIFRTGIGEFHPKCELFDNHYGNWGEVDMRRSRKCVAAQRNPLAERVKELEQIEAENARLREELNALKETQENVEATHRLTLREVQAELMRFQTKIDDMKDCILCDAEPVAWLDFHNRADPQLSVSFDATATVKSFDTDVVWKEPLYKARTK